MGEEVLPGPAWSGPVTLWPGLRPALRGGSRCRIVVNFIAAFFPGRLAGRRLYGPRPALAAPFKDPFPLRVCVCPGASTTRPASETDPVGPVGSPNRRVQGAFGTPTGSGLRALSKYFVGRVSHNSGGPNERTKWPSAEPQPAPSDIIRRPGDPLLFRFPRHYLSGCIIPPPSRPLGSWLGWAGRVTRCSGSVAPRGRGGRGALLPRNISDRPIHDAGEGDTRGDVC